jgi:hypothetical protein
MAGIMAGIVGYTEWYAGSIRGRSAVDVKRACGGVRIRCLCTGLQVAKFEVEPCRARLALGDATLLRRICGLQAYELFTAAVCAQ